MVIFHSYVKLPEGKNCDVHHQKLVCYLTTKNRKTSPTEMYRNMLDLTIRNCDVHHRKMRVKRATQKKSWDSTGSVGPRTV
jgi:hypothetical protein